MLTVWQRTIVTPAGDVVPSASVEVRRESDGLLTTLYDNPAGTGSPLANPLTADAEGFVQFYTAAGAHRIVASSGGFSRTWRYEPFGDAQYHQVGTDSGEIPTVDDTDARYLAQASNLSDLEDAAEARDNLGLGTAALLDEGTNSGELTTVDTVVSLIAAASYQPLDADLTALAGLADLGFATRTGTGAWANRTIRGAASEARITVTEGDGVGGDPQIDLTPLTGERVVVTDADGYPAASAITSENLLELSRLTDGILDLAAGAVGTPSLYWDGNDTTGFYQIGANNIGFAVSGSKVLDILSTGFDVSATAPALKLNKTTSNTSSSSFQLLDQSVLKGLIGLAGNTNSLITTSVQNDLCIRGASGNSILMSTTSGTIALKIAATTENVLIGTGTDDGTHKLQVAGSASFTGILTQGAIAPVTGVNINLNKTLTGATTAVGMQSDGVIQSGVTSVARYHNVSISTAAASFTCTNAAAYRAAIGSIGAGSAITNLFGFAVDSSFVGATTLTMGFRGAIPAASGRWNLYMDGTANNYLAGNTLIGTTTDDGSNKLQVAGNIIQKTPVSTDSIMTIDATSTNVSQRLNFAANGTIQAQIYNDSTVTRFRSVTNIPLTFGVNNTEGMRLSATNNNLLIGTTTDDGTNKLQVNGNGIRIATAQTPASASATGVAGTIAWDTNFIYVCTATNTWKRVAIATW